MKLFLSILSLIFVLMISSCSGSFDFEDTIFDNENLSNDDNDSIICTEEAKICPDGSSVGRVGPNCEFAACPEFLGCTEEAKICPDGSSVGRVGPNCEFAACPDFEEENKSIQRLVFSSKPIIPMDKIYSANFDKIQNFKGEEISGQGITYSDESFSRNIYRGFNINDTYPQIWPIDLNDSSWKIGSNRVGEWQEYTFDILKSGTYLPKLKMSSLNGPQSNSSFRLYLNGNFLMDLNTYKTGSWNTWETIEYAPINLSLGENQIFRVEVLSSGSDWHSLWFEEYTPKDEIKKLEVFFEASSTSINSGESATLTWTSINANSCSGTGFSTGGKTSGSIKVSPSASTTYTLTCSGLEKSDSKTIFISLIKEENSNAELLFNSGFESGTFIRNDNEKRDKLGGIDTSVPIPNDWSKIQGGLISYELGKSEDIWGRIIKEPGTENQVLSFYAKESVAYKTRIQMNIAKGMAGSEFTYRVKMYIHPDFNLLKNYEKTFSWLTIAEFWNNEPWSNIKYPFRITVNLPKTSAGNVENFYFSVSAQDMEVDSNGYPTKSSGMIKTTIWREVSKVPVPIGEWFELEYYIKEGNNNEGRFVLSIRKDGQKKQKIFDITNWTHHSKATYTDGFQSIDPLKMYTSNDITDHIRNRGGALQFYWDDFRFYSGDNRES